MKSNAIPTKSSLSLKEWLQVLAITGLCVFIFIGIRMLPVTPCGFLHCEVLSVDGDGIELCKADRSTFVDLKRMQFPILLTVEPEKTLIEGIENSFILSLETKGKKPILPHELSWVHTKQLHLLVVDESLEDYQHIHPEPLSVSGPWLFNMTPRRGGEYRFLAEIIPERTKKQAVGQARLKVVGTQKQLRMQSNRFYQLKGYTFELVIDPEEPTVSAEYRLTLKIKHEGGKDVVLEPLMAAYAHMVAFDADGMGYAHIHPLPPSGKEKDPQNPELLFTLNTQKSGWYRLWAQMKLDGEELFVPFDVYVKS